MRCADVDNLIEAHLDEGVPDVRVHVAMCTRCANELAIAQQVRSELRALPIQTPSKVHKVSGTRALVPLLAAASVLVIIATSVLYQQQQQQRAEVAAQQARYALGKLAEVSRVAGLAPTQGEKQ